MYPQVIKLSNWNQTEALHLTCTQSLYTLFLRFWPNSHLYSLQNFNLNCKIAFCCFLCQRNIQNFNIEWQHFDFICETWKKRRLNVFLFLWPWSSSVLLEPDGSAEAEAHKATSANFWNDYWDLKHLLLCVQVLNAVSECIEKEGYSYVVEDDLQGQQAADHVHSSPRRR